MELPICSVIVVNFNGQRFLDKCLGSLEKLDYPPDRLEILLVDNGSDDGSDSAALVRHPRVRLLRNPVNNFAAALNLGIAKSKGSYIAFANNDVFVDPDWLAESVRVLERNSQIGCVGGKILFENGRINSVCSRPLPDFFWEDEGYNQEDRGQYDSEREVEALCWAAVLFRKTCLDEVGPADEDFVMYFEDVDLSRRCLQRGWKIVYTPRALAVHVFQGSSQGSSLAEFFCDRNRLIYLAKHHPEKLAWAVETSRFAGRSDWEALYDNLPIVLRKLAEHHPADTVERVLERLCGVLVPVYGPLAVDNLLRQMQVILGYRKMSLGIYDHALHLIGGGQKYGCTMACELQEDFDVTLIANRPVRLEDLEAWYHLPLSRCQLKCIPLPFFDKSGMEVDPTIVTPEVANPLAPIAAESQKFDVFVNVNQLTLVRPWSPFSIFLCHFPDTLREHYFAAHEYSCLIVNSLYTARWVRALWGLEPTVLLYPPVDTAGPAEQKDNIILSVARFEISGRKKQHELIRAFERLWTSHPHVLGDWRLVLVGGSPEQNSYLEWIRRLVRESSAPVEIRVNVPFTELRSFYAKARIFWHACGLGETDARLLEHFGMTTVEAMQNQCVPIVINAGGQREIVEHGRSGYRFDTLNDLCQYTLRVIETPRLMEKLGEAARERGQVFARKNFEEFVQRFFQALHKEYSAVLLPDPREILRNRRRPNLFWNPVARWTQAGALGRSAKENPSCRE